MSRRARIAVLIVLAAGCGSSGVGSDGGAGKAGTTGSAGTVGSGGSGGSDNIDASFGFDLVTPGDANARDGRQSDVPIAGTTGTAGVTGVAGTTGSAGTAAAGTTGAAGVSAAAGASAAGTTGSAGVTGAGGALVGGANVRLFAGVDTFVLDQGPSCTNEEGATGDRWCAFIAIPATGTGANLFVVNVSQALRGATVSCPDANCIQLTSAFAESNDGSHAAMFQGDTLTYFDSSSTPYVWRPGMAFAKRLIIASVTTGALFGCIAAPKGTGVMCLRQLPAAMQTNANLVVSDLLAGRADGTGNPLLTKVDTVITDNLDDMAYLHFSYGFPAPGSNNIAWSSRQVAGGPEVLKLQKLDDAASRVTVASDVHDWDVSPDGSRWYWMSQLDNTQAIGTVQTAPFPGGANPTSVVASAVQFLFAGTTSSLVTLTSTGALSGIADPVTAPGTLTALDTAVLGIIGMSPQGHVAYVKNYDSLNDLTDMLVRKFDATSAACTLSSTPNVFYPGLQFSDDAGAAVWLQVGAMAVSGNYTRTTDCMNTTFTNDSFAAVPIANRGVVSWEAVNGTTGVGTLRYRVVNAGNMLAAGVGTAISSGVGTFDFGDPAPGIVLYTVNANGATDGVYARWLGP